MPLQVSKLRRHPSPKPNVFPVSESGSDVDLILRILSRVHLRERLRSVVEQSVSEQQTGCGLRLSDSNYQTRGCKHGSRFRLLTTPQATFSSHSIISNHEPVEPTQEPLEPGWGLTNSSKATSTCSTDTTVSSKTSTFQEPLKPFQGPLETLQIFSTIVNNWNPVNPRSSSSVVYKMFSSTHEKLRALKPWQQPSEPAQDPMELLRNHKNLWNCL